MVFLYKKPKTFRVLATKRNLVVDAQPRSQGFSLEPELGSSTVGKSPENEVGRCCKMLLKQKLYKLIVDCLQTFLIFVYSCCFLLVNILSKNN